MAASGTPIIQPGFWTLVDSLVDASEVVIERAQGSRHPRFPESIYPLDYGYLAGTSSPDGSEVDVWVGSLTPARLVGVLLTVDLGKLDLELKLLLGCTAAEVARITAFSKSDQMQAAPILRFQEMDPE